MWKNIVDPDRPPMTVWRMRFACWITKATDTHSEHVILTAFPLPQWLHECASMLRYAYISCLVEIERVQFNLLPECCCFEILPCYACVV
jgi:hypothetical protein